MIKQKINLVADWLLSVRKRLSETLKLWKNWCSQKVQHFRNWIKSSRINKMIRKFIGGKQTTKKPAKKKTAAKKKTTTTKKK